MLTSQVAPALKAMDSAVSKVGPTALVAGLDDARDAAARAFGGRGLGRSLAKQGETARNWMSEAKVNVSGTSATGTVAALGLAGIAEQGGRTKPHSIRSTRPSGVLGNPRTGFAASTKRTPIGHPGGNILAQDNLRKAVDALARVMGTKIESELTKMASKL